MWSNENIYLELFIHLFILIYILVQYANREKYWRETSKWLCISNPVTFWVQD